MSLAIDVLGRVEPAEQETPKIYSEAYRHSIVDSSYQPERSLLTLVEGTPRLGEYYRQFLGADEEPGSFDPDSGPTYQSYTRIKQMIVVQEGDGSFNSDPEKGENSKTHNGWVINDITPIRGDVIVMDIGDGRAGLFTLTEQPEIRNFTSNKVYYITYQLLGILTEDLFAKLNNRVVEELVYTKDSMLHGGNSLVTQPQFNLAGELFGWRTTIARHLMANFFWKPELTMVWETEAGKKVYDQYLVNFINAVMEPDLRGSYPPINQFSTEYGGREYGVFGTINIWEVLLKGDFNLLSQCSNEAALVDTNRLMNTRLYGNLRSSKIDLFVTTDPKEYKQYLYYYNMDGFPILVPSVETKLPYLFTDEFFEGNPIEEFESIVFDILKNKLVDRNRLLTYCKGYFNLDKKQQLYNGAILLLLINISRRLGGPL